MNAGLLSQLVLKYHLLMQYVNYTEDAENLEIA